MGLREANGVLLVHVPADIGQVPKQDAQHRGQRRLLYTLSRKMIRLADITRLKKVWLHCFSKQIPITSCTVANHEVKPDFNQFHSIT